MGHSIRDIEVQSNAGDLTAEISDEELEAAAITTTHAVMSFPSAPTVSVVFMCCGNEYPPENVTQRFAPQTPCDVVLKAATLPHTSDMPETDEP
jgi:hypothetical protein